jgi:hypothetical protein
MLGDGYARCRCNCGTEKIVRLDGVKSGRVVSCGCFNKAAKTRHGHLALGSPTSKMYRCWLSMLARCYNPKNKSFSRYGGRGVTVCTIWRRSFDCFFRDVGFPPAACYSLDRIDNEGAYEPGNVKWSTPEEQCRNRRSNRLITFQGEEKTMTEWAAQFGLKPATLWARLRSGWPMERAAQAGKAA